MAGANAPLAQSANAPTATKPGAYSFLGFMVVLNVMNILDRQLLPTFANEIVADLSLSKSEFGLLSGILFVLLYGILSPFMGMIADTTHRPRFAAMGLALWSALTAASGAARNFVGLALPRIFIGVGESTLSPTALSMVADRFPPSKLGLASGIYYAGVPLAAELGGAFNIELVSPQAQYLKGAEGRPGKVERATPLLNKLEKGEVFLPRYNNQWLAELESEWLSWTGLADETADQVDAAAYAVTSLLTSPGREETIVIDPWWRDLAPRRLRWN